MCTYHQFYCWGPSSVLTLPILSIFKFPCYFDRYNLCALSNNVQESTKCCKIICDQVFKPLMEKPHEDFPSMCSALLLGVKAFVPSNDPEAFLLFTKHLCGIDVSLANLDAYGRFMYRLQDFIHTYVLQYSVLRFLFKPILNFNMWLSIFICEKFTSTVSALHFGKGEKQWTDLGR